MRIRKGTHDDINDIVKLLKLSLGESLMPKTNEYWKWKHIENPFGESDVLLAYDGDLLVGVRAFMKWIWYRSGTELKSVRAVDTVTHPEYQGRGIFKKLTLQLVDECSKADVSLIYNTPNDKSAPGYLKMGWSTIGKLPVKISIKRPFNLFVSKTLRKRETQFLTLGENEYLVDNVLDSWPEHDHTQFMKWNTKNTRAFMVWRYKTIPVIQYYGCGNGEAAVIFRLRTNALGKELRVCDYHGGTDKIESLLKDIYKKLSFDFLSISGFNKMKLPGNLRMRLNLGPQVTVRPVKTDKTFGFHNFELWSPSLGDLEVF